MSKFYKNDGELTLFVKTNLRMIGVAPGEVIELQDNENLKIQYVGLIEVQDRLTPVEPNESEETFDSNNVIPEEELKGETTESETEIGETEQGKPEGETIEDTTEEPSEIPLETEENTGDINPESDAPANESEEIVSEAVTDEGEIVTESVEDEGEIVTETVDGEQFPEGEAADEVTEPSNDETIAD